MPSLPTWASYLDIINFKSNIFIYCVIIRAVEQQKDLTPFSQVKPWDIIKENVLLGRSLESPLNIPFKNSAICGFEGISSLKNYESSNMKLKNNMILSIVIF